MIKVSEIDVSASTATDETHLNVVQTEENPQKFPGQMQILAFADLKDQLGDRWDQSKPTVHATVEKILMTELGPWDFSTLIGQDNYLIIYGEDNVSAAETTSRLIGEKVTAGFGGKFQSRLMDVRPQNGKLQQMVLAEADLDTPLNEEILPKGSPRWKEIPKPEKSFSDAERLDTAIEGVQASEAKKRDRYEAAYVPFWNARREVLAGYAVLPYRRREDGPAISGYDLLGSYPSPADFLKLDADMLQTQIEVCAELYQNAFAALLTSQIHFETLSSATGRKEIRAIAQKIPDTIKQFLMLQIVGVPEHTPPSAVAQRIAGLPALFRAVTIRIPSTDFPVSACATMGATTIAYEVPPGQTEETFLATARKIISAAKTAKLLTTFEKVSNVAMASALKEAGATFVSGDVLGKPADAPENTQRLSLKELANYAKQ